jgi:hypothetical protein
MDRRRFLQHAFGTGLVLAAGPAIVRAQGAGASAALPAMTVYKSATCGCCRNWVQHARGAGFPVRVVDTEDLDRVKAELGVPLALQSCHTVVVGAYLIEGHVPAADVKALLARKPAVRGLAVPGMPVGAPGMEQGDPRDYDRYDVIAFTAVGRTSVFARH